MENSINPVFGNYVVITKKNQKEMAERIVQQVLNGENNPVDVFVQIKGICDSLSAALKNKDLIDAVIDESQKYDKQMPIYHGAVVAVSEVGVKYDFTVCKDPQMDRLLAQKNELDEKIKARQKFLMGVPDEGVCVADPETGEMVDVIRPPKTSTTSIRVTFPKE